MYASLYNWIVYKRESKARERKEEEGQCRSKIYTILWSRDCNYVKLSETACDCPPQSTVFYQRRNINSKYFYIIMLIILISIVNLLLKEE